MRGRLTRIYYRYPGTMRAVIRDVWEEATNLLKEKEKLENRLAEINKRLTVLEKKPSKIVEHRA